MPLYTITGSAGWYKFLTITVAYGSSYIADIYITDTFSHSSNNGLLSIAIDGLATMNVSVFWNTVVSGSSHTIKYTIDDTYTVSFYIYKYSASSGLIEFRIINSSLRNGSYVDLSPLWQNTSVSEPENAILVPIQTALTAENVGALAVDGIANSAKILSVANIVTNIGWNKFFELTSNTINKSYSMTLLISSGYTVGRGILRIYINHSSADNVSCSVSWIATNYSLDSVKYSVNGKTVTLYIDLVQGSKYIRVLSAEGRNSNASFDPTPYWLNVAVEEPVGATNASGNITNNAATATNATNDINGDQINTTYLKSADAANIYLTKTETAKTSYSLVPTKVYPGNLTKGWYKFATITIPSTTGRAKITFKYGSSTASFDFIGEIFFYKTNSTSMAALIQIPYAVAAKNTYFKCNVDIANSTTSLYVYKHDNAGSPVFTIISSEDLYGNYIEPSTYMLESLVAEAPPSTAIDALYSSISRWITNVPVSIGTNQQILSYSANMITSATVLAKVEFTNPEYIKSDCLWETTDGLTPLDNGTLTLTGTCTTATTANLLLLNVYIP